jgi:hypothetical protein
MTGIVGDRFWRCASEHNGGRDGQRDAWNPGFFLFLVIPARVVRALKCSASILKK